jgi:hypothetical protein
MSVKEILSPKNVSEKKVCCVGKMLKVGIRIYEFRAMNLSFYEFLLLLLLLLFIFTCKKSFGFA